MKKVESAGDMVHQLNKQIRIKHIDHFFAQKASTLATLMQGTHGREKMCALIQYTFTLYFECMQNSEEVWNHSHWSVASA